MPDKLRDEIAEVLRDIHSRKEYIQTGVDRIDSIYGSQRCVWTKVESNGVVYYGSSCHDGFPLGWSMTMRPFCPCCGLKIEVRDGQ